MRLLGALCALACAATVAARSPQHVGRSIPGYVDVHERARMQQRAAMDAMAAMKNPVEKRAPVHLNDKTKPFAVDGANIPEVDFDIGESYAGLLPLTHDKDEDRKLYFWYFPTNNKLGEKEIIIWLNGGPGCSSLEGLLQEAGPFLWQYGTLKPVPNPWFPGNLSSMVFIEQPIGTGFTQGTPTAKTEDDVANQFIGWWKVFVDTFSLQGYKIFIAGESYAGQYVPHIANAMLNKKDTKYYDLDSTMIYDPSINTLDIMNSVPAPMFVKYWEHLFAFNQSFMDHIDQVDEKCGLSKYIEDNLVYPPKGQLPKPPSGCNYLYNIDIYNAALEKNPCWDIYQVATTCPILYDVLGFPGTIPYLPPGGEIYFDRADVKKAINAPLNVHWQECSSKNVYNTSNGLSEDSNHGRFSSVTVLPSVIERSNRTIIAHGQLDFILLTNGTLLSIQNMTWHGKRGFQSPPTADFYVPPHRSYQDVTLAGHGVFGKTHTERGLTFVQVDLCGHMQPQYQPSSSYRHFEFLLGRVPSLTSHAPFTTSNYGLIGEPDAPQ